jgi:deazaflavin-dependent oxidoreductase (nitroreductase family)
MPRVSCLLSGWLQMSDERSRSMSEAQAEQKSTQARRGTVIVFGLGSRLLNPVMAKLAGKRHVRQFAVLQHRGRRSGRVYETPVVAQRTPDGFVVPMPFGEKTDWFRNLQAAGEGIIRWNGVAYHVVEPQMVDWTTARPDFHRLERLAVPVLGIQRFARLRYVPADASHAA